MITGNKVYKQVACGLIAKLFNFVVIWLQFTFGFIACMAWCYCAYVFLSTFPYMYWGLHSSILLLQWNTSMLYLSNQMNLHI